MGKRPSVLIVESRQNVRTFLEMTLSQARVRSFSAVNLSSALLQLRVFQPDLIIIGDDRQAGELNAAAAQIRALSASPLLALGHDAGPAPLPDHIEYLPGAFTAGQLCAKVAELVGRRAAAEAPG